MDADADESLMQQVAEGDRRGFYAELFDRYQRARRGQCPFRFVGDRSRAEELTQDIFIKLFQNAKGYKPSRQEFKTSTSSAVATNHCLSEVRRGEHRVQARLGPRR